MLEVDHNPILKLKRRLHGRRVPEHPVPVEVDHRELDLLDGELLADASPGCTLEYTIFKS